MSRPKTIIADVCLWQKYTTAVHRHPDESFTQRLRPELHQMLNTSNYRNCLSNIGSQVQNISYSSPASSPRVWLVKSLTSEMIASDTFSGVEMTSPSSVDTTDFSLTINFSAPIRSNYHHYTRFSDRHLYQQSLFLQIYYLKSCNLRFWSRAGGCWLTDNDGPHRGLRCSGLNSGQCIYPVYGGHLPVLRTCSDHSNQIFDTSYVCYGGSMKYSRQEYPHCRCIHSQSLLL